MDLNTISIEQFNNRTDGDATLRYCEHCKIIAEISHFYKKKDKQFVAGYRYDCKVSKANYRIRNSLSQRLNNINQRCTGRGKWKSYLEKGIKNFLILDDLHKLWERDNAGSMKMPSIDRKDNAGNYTFDNCRFMELRENVIKDKYKPVLQLSIDGEILASFPSVNEAAKKHKIHASKISLVLHSKGKTAAGFVWKFGIKEAA